MDKVQKIREEVERMHNLLPVMDGDNISVNYADRICTTLEMYIDSLQEEHVSRTPADIEAAMQEVEEKSKAFTEALICDETKYLPWQNVKEEVLPTLRGEEPVNEDLEEAVNAYIGYAPEVDECSSVYGKRKAFKAGAKWQLSQLMRNAIEVVISDDTTICNAVELMKLQEKYKGQKVKIAIIKED